MPGTLHIFRLDPELNPAARIEPQYQANYSTPGNNYARAYTEPMLKEFLRFTLALSHDGVMRVIEQLHNARQVTLSDVEIPIEEAGPLGFDQLPSDG